MFLLWEQEVGGSNPLAPTSLRFKRSKDAKGCKNPPTSKFKPWRIKTTIAFTGPQKTLDFEEHLKNPFCNR